MTLTKVTFSMIDGNVFNVLDYGADRTGVADSAPAIQAAIDEMDQTGFGGIIFLPSGDYKCNAGLSVPNLIRLVGEGMDSTNIRYQGNGTAVALPGTSLNTVVKAGLKNLSVYGNASSQFGVKADYSVDCVFENLRIYGHNVGMYLNWSYNNMLNFVKADNCIQDGFFFDDEANANTMLGCIGTENGRSGLYAIGGRAVDAVNCTWEANGDYGVYLLGNQNGTYRPKSINLSNCYIEGNGTAEVFIDKTVGAEPPIGIAIKDCYFCALLSKATQAIRVENCSGVQIENCTFDDQGVPYAYSLYVPGGSSVENLVWGDNSDRSTNGIFQGEFFTQTSRATAFATAQFSGKGSVTVNSVYNVSSITRTGAGAYTLVLVIPASSTTFCVIANAEDGSLGTPGLFCSTISTAADTVLIKVYDFNGVATDGRNVSVAVFNS